MIRVLRWVSLMSTLALTSFSGCIAGVAAGPDPRLAADVRRLEAVAVR